MAFTPDSTVYLLDTPLDILSKNQIHFSSKEQQTNYFSSKQKHVFNDVTYQRKDSHIRVDSVIDKLWNVNYVMYRNENFSNKWFYAFIVKMEYVSDRATDIFIETDVYQTWMLECSLKTSFVVREHVKDDTIGLHRVDEQLEYGEYKMKNEFIPVNKLGANWNILAVSDNEPLGNSETIGNLYGNVVTGLTYFPFPNNRTGIDWLKSIVDIYDEAGKPEAINMIFSVPEMIIPMVKDSSFQVGKWMPTGEPYGFALTSITKNNTDLDGYTPKNNKMHTNPYKFLYMSNSVGQSANYNYEDFTTSGMDFILFGSVMPNPTIMITPSDYKGVGMNYDYGLTLSGFPMGAWTSDTYTAWFAQNGASTGVAIAGSALAIVGGVATGNGFAIAGGALGVFSQMAQLNKASMQPDQAKGQVGSGSLRFGDNSLDFFYAHMTIRKDYAKRVDDYLTMFGYKVNALKVPETLSRTQWNYIQTIDVNIDGAIPNEDMKKLKSLYDSGITLWHNSNNFLNYSLNNSIR